MLLALLAAPRPLARPLVPATADQTATAPSNCRKGTVCEPDVRSCMGRGTNTVWGFHVRNADDATWNGDYSPGSPRTYIENRLRYDLNGDKDQSPGRTLYSFAGQWKLAWLDNEGYANGPFGNTPDSGKWLKYGTEKTIAGMEVRATIIRSDIPGWYKGVVCIETEARALLPLAPCTSAPAPALSPRLRGRRRSRTSSRWPTRSTSGWSSRCGRRGDAPTRASARARRRHLCSSHPSVATAPNPATSRARRCTDCDRMWKQMEEAEAVHKSNTLFLAVDVNRCYSIYQAPPLSPPPSARPMWPLLHRPLACAAAARRRRAARLRAVRHRLHSIAYAML